MGRSSPSHWMTSSLAQRRVLGHQPHATPSMHCSHVSAARQSIPTLGGGEGGGGVRDAGRGGGGRSRGEGGGEGGMKGIGPRHSRMLVMGSASSPLHAGANPEVSSHFIESGHQAHPKVPTHWSQER